jgi:hypothetical protein
VVGEAWEGRARSGAPLLAGVVHGHRRLERRRRWRESLSRARIRLEEEQCGGGGHQRVASDLVPRRLPESSMGTVDVDPHQLRPRAFGSTSHLAAVSLRSLLLRAAPWPAAVSCGGLRSNRCTRAGEQTGRGWRWGHRGGGGERGRWGGNWLGFGGERGCGRVGVLGGVKCGGRGCSQNCPGAFAKNGTISSLRRNIV